MKKYTFEVTVFEGNDGFWESLEGKTGCDELTTFLTEIFESAGFCLDDNLTIKLKEYKDE